MNIFKIKKEYNSPEIYCIKLDNEISLVLESVNPMGEPGGDGWDSQNLKEIQFDPFKSQLG